MGIIGGVWSWLTEAEHWTADGGILQRLGEHAYLTFACLVISCVLAVPIALWLGHVGRGGALAVNISNAGRAVPTFAVLVLLSMSPLGKQGDLPTLIALVLFALPPLLTNTYTGVREADREVVEAARGMGMTGWQTVRQVELPLAFPMIMTGVQTAAVQLVATATLAALPGGGGLGRLITAGFGNYDTPQVVSGALLVAAMALLLQGLLTAAERALSPMRRRPGAQRLSAAGPVPVSDQEHASDHERPAPTHTAP
ncbi:ABC transporter permease [Streptomyces iconiensis]|uniref:ABC transporter permease n=1 Tax=Streptomyces iconiensis TaxID=1384038 RepID=A0ABT6ZSD0_9ACTN|nr:ABC transporter permease [Streptomyces iconiensis]MDJ1131970.1 ABC transporter permease [Streptomyces iconiensis]